MAFTSVTLTDPVSGTSLAIMPVDGVTCLSLDVQPTVRSSSEERVGGAGQVDTTQNLSVAAVTLALRLWPASSGGLTPELFLDQLGLLLAPSLRPNLICTNDQWAGPRQLTVRFDSKSAIVDNPMSTDASISWKAPLGIWQSPSNTRAVVPAYIATIGGLAQTLTGVGVGLPGIAFTPATLTGSPVVTSGGNVAVPWTGKLYGPCAGPSLINDTAGAAVTFTTALNLGPGEYVALDSQARTALLHSDPSQSVLGFLDFANSSWWQMQPGLNTIRYSPASALSSSQAVINFQTGWIP